MKDMKTDLRKGGVSLHVIHVSPVKNFPAFNPVNLVNPV